MNQKPVRMCVVCRQRFSKEELSRYVCPDTTLELETDGPVPDPEKPNRDVVIMSASRPGAGKYSRK